MYIMKVFKIKPEFKIVLCYRDPILIIRYNVHKKYRFYNLLQKKNKGEHIFTLLNFSFFVKLKAVNSPLNRYEKSQRSYMLVSVFIRRSMFSSTLLLNAIWFYFSYVSYLNHLTSDGSVVIDSTS